MRNRDRVIKSVEKDIAKLRKMIGLLDECECIYATAYSDVHVAILEAIADLTNYKNNF